MGLWTDDNFLNREVYQDMEQGLEILGATAIEDKLQVYSRPLVCGPPLTPSLKGQ
jgi:hypothetical protein